MNHLNLIKKKLQIKENGDKCDCWVFVWLKTGINNLTRHYEMIKHEDNNVTET